MPAAVVTSSHPTIRSAHDHQNASACAYGAHAPINLEAGREHEIAQDDAYGAWRVRERVTQTT
jgi:hypothetical protein